MMIYQEKIAPPLPLLSDEEQMAALVEALAREDRWVDSFIARLTATIREIRH
jgi:hypothetical protein